MKNEYINHQNNQKYILISKARLPVENKSAVICKIPTSDEILVFTKDYFEDKFELITNKIKVPSKKIDFYELMNTNKTIDKYSEDSKYHIWFKYKISENFVFNCMAFANGNYSVTVIGLNEYDNKLVVPEVLITFKGLDFSRIFKRAIKYINELVDRYPNGLTEFIKNSIVEIT